MQELMFLIKQPHHEKKIKEFIEQEIEKGLPEKLNTDMPLSPERAAILFSNIIGDRKKETVKIIYLWRYAAAAVMIGAVATLGYFSFKQSDTTPVVVAAAIKKIISPVVNDVLPGTKGAVLTLSDGQQIVLDSAGNGRLTSQGSTIIINKNGQIVYDTNGDVPGEVLYNTMTTPRGRQYQLLLSDGTKVWLNSESSIRYPAAFSGDTRSVNITGEAYFEVAPLSPKGGHGKVPFIVRVNSPSGDGGMEVKVLGTHFNINAYQDEESIKTTLLEGSVQVNIPGDETVLAPGQQSKIYKTGLTQLVQHADLEEAVAWKNGVFSFTNADIQSVMRQIARWFDLEINYEGEIPKDHFGGRLPMNAKVSEVLGALEQTQVHFRIEGKRLIVMP